MCYIFTSIGTTPPGIIDYLYKTGGDIEKNFDLGKKQIGLKGSMGGDFIPKNKLSYRAISVSGFYYSKHYPGHGIMCIMDRLRDRS